jgi:hypothetical protein
MKRCEDIYKHRDITKMRMLLHSYMQDYRACEYYDIFLDSFKLLMIQQNGLDLNIIRINKQDEPESPSKLARYNSIIRQPSTFDYRKKSVSFNDRDSEIIYEESSDKPHKKTKKRSPPQSSISKAKGKKPDGVEKEQQMRNLKRVEKNLKVQDAKMKQRTCWYKESCECNVI